VPTARREGIAHLAIVPRSLRAAYRYYNHPRLRMRQAPAFSPQAGNILSMSFRLPPTRPGIYVNRVCQLFTSP
jgi:hypothetical protein